MHANRIQFGRRLDALGWGFLVFDKNRAVGRLVDDHGAAATTISVCYFTMVIARSASLSGLAILNILHFYRGFIGIALTSGNFER